MAERPQGLTIAIHETLTPEELAAFDAVESAAFGDGDWTAEKAQEIADRYSSDADTVGYVVAHIADDLVGTIRIFMRTVPYAGRTVRLGGLGGVATHPDWRGRGIAEATVSVAMEALRQRGSEVAYLCALPELGRRLYAKAGFAPLERPYTYRGRSGKGYTDHDGWLAPLTDPDLCAAMLAGPEPFDLAGSNW
jgi:predicted N-acetyltransferase YhbS